jgi:hypothetical protein
VIFRFSKAERNEIRSQPPQFATKSSGLLGSRGCNPLLSVHQGAPLSALRRIASAAIGEPVARRKL